MLSILTLARDVRRRTCVRAVVAASALVAAVVVPSVYAHALAAPANIQPPTLDAAPAVGSFLAPTPGSWSGSPTSFSYQLLRCPGGGGAADGSNCTMVGPPTPDIRPLELESRDVGYSFRVRVTATNAAGSASVVSAPSHQTLVTTINITGCPPVNSAGVINIDTISPPARLEIKAHTSTPAVITRSTQRITLRFQVGACDGQEVRGALVYATPTPFAQFSGPEATTNATGWATITLTRERYFPATPRQQNLIVFVRARKPGEDLLGGISGRRLVSFRVRL